MDPHTLKDYDGESKTVVDMNIQKTADFVSVKEPAQGDAYREILVEQTGGVICVRVYAVDSDTPMMIKLPPEGGIIVERVDYDDSIREENA